MLKWFSRQTKFAKGAVQSKLKFAWSPTFIDGGVRRIWLQPFYRLYTQDQTYMNWDMPDTFSCIGDYSTEGKARKFAALQKADPRTHWASADSSYFPGYLPPVN
jgi:hypothetical protein